MPAFPMIDQSREYTAAQRFIAEPGRRRGADISSLGLRLLIAALCVVANVPGDVSDAKDHNNSQKHQPMHWRKTTNRLSEHGKASLNSLN
jgi:hypothetical protein